MSTTVLAVDAPGTRWGGYVVLTAKRKRVDLRYRSTIDLTKHLSERECYVDVWNRMKAAAGCFDVDVVVIEHPFLHVIAGWVGAVKMWAAVNGLPWYMIGASSARKAVHGKGRASKADALALATARWATTSAYFESKWTQHEADAALYGLAYLVKEKGLRL